MIPKSLLCMSELKRKHKRVRDIVSCQMAAMGVEGTMNAGAVLRVCGLFSLLTV